MGLFEKAGRQFERIKQNVTAAAEESAEYECASCGRRLFAQPDACPECGATEFVRTEPVRESGSDAASDSSNEPGRGASADATAAAPSGQQHEPDAAEDGNDS